MKVTIADTEGQENYDDLGLDAYSGSHIILLCFDIANEWGVVNPEWIVCNTLFHL